MTVVFRKPPFPATFWGYPVIDGDQRCPSGKLHLQSGVNPRDDDPVGAGGPVREITPCRKATPLIQDAITRRTRIATAAAPG